MATGRGVVGSINIFDEISYAKVCSGCLLEPSSRSRCDESSKDHEWLSGARKCSKLQKDGFWIDLIMDERRDYVCCFKKRSGMEREKR
jgi:hypothetical protein